MCKSNFGRPAFRSCVCSMAWRFLPNSLVEFHTGETSYDTSAWTRRNKTRMRLASGSTTRRARTSTTSRATPFRRSRSDGSPCCFGPTTTGWRPFSGGLYRTRGRAGRTLPATRATRRRGRGGLVGNDYLPCVRGSSDVVRVSSSRIPQSAAPSC